MRNNDVAQDGLDQFGEFKKAGTIPHSHRTPEQRQKDFDDCLAWIRNENKDSKDPTGEFRKLDSMIPRKHGQSPEDRARQLEGSLDWLRNKSVGPAADMHLPGFDKIGSVPSQRRTPEQRKKDLDDIMAWTRNGKKASDDPTGSFNKVDQILPRKKGQSPDDRAHEIENAIDWMRSNGVSPIQEDVSGAFKKIGSLPVARRTPEQRKKDTDDCLNWLRNKGKNDDLLDPTGEFRKMDSLLPQKGGQSLDERALAVESALDWCRQQGVTPDFEEADLPFSKVAIQPVARRSPEERQKDLDAVNAWIRNGKRQMDDPSGIFNKLDHLLPKKRAQSPEERARDIEGTMDWMRNSDVSPVDDASLEKFKKMGGIPVSSRTPEQRTKDLADVLTWIRSPINDVASDPTGEFMKLNVMLPKQRGQTPEDRAAQIESALDWSRTKDGGNDPTDQPMPSFTKGGSLPISRRAPEQRQAELDSVTSWIRNGKPDSEDPSGDFKRFDQLLPRKPRQSSEARAREIEGTMDWMRNTGVTPFDDANLDNFKTIGSIPVSRRTPEQRSKDLNDTLNWIRNKGSADAVNDPTGEFRKIDAALPQKRGQTHGERAREIEGALDWLRSKTASEFEEKDVPTLSQVGSIPISCRSPEARKSDLDSALAWIRNGKIQDEALADEFRKIDQMLPKKSGQSPEDRAREIEGCMDWIRNKNISVDDVERNTEFSTIGSFPLSRRSPEQRGKDLNDCLNWLRNKGLDDESLDPTGEFRTVDSLVPKRRNHPPEDRARLLEGALDWMRNNEATVEHDERAPASKHAGSLPVSRRTPEQRQKEAGDVVTWIRSKKDASLDPSGEFKKIDQILPVKPGQTSRERAADMEKALDWIRNHGMTLGDADDDIPAFKMIGSIPVSSQSPENRQSHLDAALSWIRNGKTSDPNLADHFKKIDQMLPQRPGQSPLQRARDIEGAL